MHKTIKPMVASVGTAFLLGASVTAQATTNPFAAEQLSSGYQQLADNHKHKEGKCGEGKCGGEKKIDKEGKCGEGKCGGEKKMDKEGKCGEGKCGGEKKMDKEGKCGEGKCGGQS